MTADQRRSRRHGAIPAAPSGRLSGRLSGGVRAGAYAAVCTLLAALTAVSAGGCSESGAAADDRPAGDPARVVRQAADALTRAGSSRVRTSMEMISGGTRVTVRGTGTFDYTKRRGRLRVVLPQGEDQPITELYAPGVVYMKNRGAGVPADEWLRLETTRLSDGNLVTNGATDPLTAAELLRGARDVTYVGEERIDGSTVRRYRGTTDIGRAAEAASPYARGSLAAAADGFAESTVAFDALLDEEGRLRKVRHRFSLAGGKRVEVTSTTELFAFGVAAGVELPSADEVYAGTVELSRAPAPAQDGTP